MRVVINSNGLVMSHVQCLSEIQMDMWRRSVKGPDGKTHFLPCSPGEPGATAATLASLAENGLAEQVCIPHIQNLTQVPVLLGKPAASPAVLASACRGRGEQVCPP